MHVSNVMFVFVTRGFYNLYMVHLNNKLFGVTGPDSRPAPPLTTDSDLAYMHQSLRSQGM